MIVDRNNAKYKFVDQTYGSEVMFCILIDNQKEDLRYMERKSSANISEFNELVARHRGFIWPEIREKISIQRNSAKRKEGKQKKGKDVQSRSTEIILPCLYN